MFSPVVAFTVASLGMSATVADTCAEGYASLAACTARLYEMVAVVRQMPVDVKVVSAKGARR